MRLVSQIAALVATGLALVGSAAGQTNGSCLSLKGSAQCPSFQDAWINPTNLSNAWPWFSNVSDVASFDDQFAQYFTDLDRYTTTKLNDQLQCNRSAVDNTALQWERTILCGQFSQISYSAQCNIENRADPIMVCQDTCIQFSDSEHDIVANPQICAPSRRLTAEHFTTRNNTLTRDYTSCTNWTTLVSTNNATCIEGVTNEGNCGFGPGVTSQLCTACDPTGNNKVSSCCYDSKTDLSECASYGHPGAALVRATSSAAPGFATPTSTISPSTSTSGNEGAEANRASNGTGLSGGQLAGIIVGCIVGALLIGALLAWLLFARKRRNQDPEASRGLVYGSGAAGRSSSGSKAWNQSEEGTTRSIGGSPLGEKQVGSAGHGLGAIGAGAGAGALAGAALGGRSSQNEEGKERPDSQLSTGTGGSDGRGTTVAQVRDQYTGQDIFPGEEVVAIYPYNASLNDEITLEPEQRVTILRLYDDGWALGKTHDGQEGALPLVCVSSTKGDVPGRAGAGLNATTSEEDGMTSGAEYTSSVDGAVTAEEGGFTSDATGNRSQRR